MVIDSSGNIGVGTNTPNSVGALTGLAGVSLKVNTTSNQARLTIEGASSGDLVLVDGNGRRDYRAVPFVVDYDSLNIGNLDETAGTTTSRLFINMSTGNVGIGTTGPGQRLAIVQNANHAPPGLGSSGGIFGIFKDDGFAGGNYGLMAGVQGDGHVWMQAQRRDGTATAYDLLLQPSGGNLGIGTTSPSSRTHIKLGNAGFSPLPITDPTSKPGLVIEGSTADDSSTPQIVIADKALGTTSNGQFIDFLTKSSTNASYDRWIVGRRGYVSSAGNLNRFMIGYTTSQNAHTAFNDPAISISSNNNVGIGTSDPQSRLHINSTTSNIYIQLPVNSTALASADCDAEAERGRMIVDGNNVRLHVCYGAGGWKTLTPA
jgi:hypothetical protein